MGRCSVTILLALSALSFASAFHTLVPNGKELVYDYKALVRAGTILPASYASEFFLHGKLHVQTTGTNAHVQLSDLKYKLYNGEREYGHQYYAEEMSLPQEAGDLQKVFKVIYNNNGQAKGIATEKQEKVFARNMHKAIANMLQMDVEKVHLDGDKSHAFVTDEYSIYGKTIASYNVIRKGDHVVVQKMHEMKSTKPMYQAMFTNVEPDYCEAHYEEPISHDSQQMYYMVKQDGHFVVKHLETTGGIYVYPFQAKSEAQYVHVNVTLNLLEVTGVQKALQVASEHVEEHLTYDIIDPSVDSTMPDILNGRRSVDVQKQIPMLQTMMTEMGEWLHQNHIHMKQPDIAHAQMINRLVRLLSIFDQTNMEQLYTTLSAKTDEQGKKHLEIFYQLLPLVGTHGSVMALKKIVHEKKVEDEIAKHMLQTFPAHVKVPTEKMLHDMEDMLNWGDEINVYVRKAAVLSFASLIHKTFHVQKSIFYGHQHEHHHHQHDMMTHDNEHINLHINGMHDYSYVSEETQKFFKEHQIYDKYVNDIAAKLKSAQDVGTKMLYMQALYNTRMYSAVEHLMPYINGEHMNEQKLRFTAMWSIIPMVIGDFEKVFEIYWPIFSNWQENTDTRILAYYIIMESHPPISRLLNMYWEMQGETNPEVYHFHYTYLLAMYRTTDPCHSVFRLNVAQILKFTRKPQFQGLSNYHQVDYIDAKYKFGGEFKAMIFGNENSRVFKFDINSQMFNIRSNYYSMYVKIDGLDETVADKIHLNLDSTASLFNYNEIWNLFTSVPDMKNINIQIVVAHRRHVVESYYFDSSNMKDFVSFFECFKKDQLSETKNTIEIQYEIYSTIVLPTEMGIPAVMEVVMPTIKHKHIKMSKDVANNVINFHLDNKYHISRPSRYGLSFYNPIADVWQGINRYHTYDFVLPVYADIAINTQQHTVKITMKRHQDEDKDTFGLRSHVTSLVFIKDDLNHDVLTKSCKKCHNWVYVTKGDQYRHNNTFYHKDGYNTGYNYHVAVYDSELHTSNKVLYDVMKQVSTKYTKNYWTPLGHFMMILRNFHMLVMFQPTPGTHGFMFKAVPTTENPVTQIDLTFRVNKEVVQEKDEFLPGIKFNTRATYTLKNKEKAVKTWDLNAVVDANPGHTLFNTKVDLTRIIPGQKDFKVCFESSDKWTKKDVSGHVNLAMGQSADSKCNKDSSVEITYVGEQLEEQKSAYHFYEICQPYSHQLGPDYQSMLCAAAHTSLRKYTYDIKTTQIPSEYKKLFTSWFGMFKQSHMPFYQFHDEHNQDVKEDSVKMVMKYTMAGNEVDVAIQTPQHTHFFNGMPIYPIFLENTHYSRMYMMMHYMGMMNTCVVHPNYVQHGFYQLKHVENFQVPNEWTMYVGEAEKSAQHGVFLKKIEGQDMMALKLMHGSHFLEVQPHGEHGEHFKIVVDGTEVSDMVDNHSEDWFTYMIRPHTHTVVITSHHFYIHMEFNGKELVLQTPKVKGVQFYGHCMKH